MMKDKDTLELTLEYRWFDMIANGVKKEEYREIKPYWWGQFCKKPTTQENVEKDLIPYKYKFVRLHRGYTNDTITFECQGISVGQGEVAWGAPRGRKVFKIRLGKEINHFRVPKGTVGGSYEDIM